MNYLERREAARQLAATAHKDQKWSGDRDYREHLSRVVGMIDKYCNPVFGVYADIPLKVYEDLMTAGWLHDVLEDTPLMPEDIQEEFGTSVTDLVWAVTGVGTNRKERNASAYDKIQRTPYALILKLADRIVNVYASHESQKETPKFLEMYKKEYPGFRAALYVSGEYDEMWQELDDLLK